MYLIEGDFCKQKKKEIQEYLFCYHDEFFIGCWDVPVNFFLMKAEVRMLLYLVIILFLIICWSMYTKHWAVVNIYTLQCFVFSTEIKMQFEQISDAYHFLLLLLYVFKKIVLSVWIS